MDYKGPVEAALSSDLRGEPRNFSLWDIHTGTQLVVFKGNNGNPIEKCLQFIDNNYFISAVDNVIQIWSIFNRKSQDQKLFLPGRPSVILTSGCGNYLIVGISEMIYIWQLHSGNLLACVQRHYQTVSCLKLSQDGAFLLSGGEDGMVLVWRFAELLTGVQNNDPKFTWQNHSAQVTDIHLMNSGRCITTSADKTVNIYSYITGKRLFCVTLPTPIWSAVMDKNETVAYFGGLDGNIYQLATSTVSLAQSNDDNGSQRPILTGHKGKVVSLILSMDGSRLISASLDTSCKIWDLRTKKMLQDVKHQAPVVNLRHVMIPESFALTSMTQSHIKPPLSVKPLKRQVYKMPRDASLMRNDVFEESSTTIINVKSKQRPSTVNDLVMFDISNLKNTKGNECRLIETNSHDCENKNQDNGQTSQLREKFRDLYMLSVEKIFHDAAEESLKPYKSIVDEIVSTDGTPNRKGTKSRKTKVKTSPKVRVKSKDSPGSPQRGNKKVKSS